MPAPAPTASVAGATRDRREVIQRMGATYSAVRIRERTAPSHGLGAAGLATSRYTRRSAPPRGGVWENCQTAASAGIRARSAAQVPTRRNLATRLSRAGPKNGRTSSGAPASSSTMVTT